MSYMADSLTYQPARTELTANNAITAGKPLSDTDGDVAKFRGHW